MRSNFRLNLTLLFYVIFGFSITSLAQDGSLDLSFDNDGKVITPIGVLSGAGYSVAIQSDGKIVVAGSSNNGSNEDFALVRYNTNGSLDSTFDTDGKVTTSIGVSDDAGYSVAIQSDGKIVVAGSSNNGSNNDFALVRYHTNGSLDSTFHADGKVTTPIGGGHEYGRSLAIQSDGKIVVAGYSDDGPNNDFALVRYNTNGSLDSTFDTDGKVITPIGGYNDVGYSVAIQSDGKIVVAGSCNNGSNEDFALVRYQTNGSLDSTFHADGKLTTPIGGYHDIGWSVAIQSNGKIVLAGRSYNGSNYDFALVRYHTNGSLDLTFDTDGKVTTPIGGYNDGGNSAAIQSDGKIVVAGYSNNGSNEDFALVRYHTNGSLDSTFDVDVKLTTPFGGSHDSGYSVAIQSDGKIVVGGSTANSIADYDFSVSRYNVIIATGINEINNQISEIEIYPNPFSTFTTIGSAKLLIHASLKVYNILGQEVKQLNNLSGRIITFNRKDLPNGLYFVQLVQNNQVILSRKLVITD